MESVIYINRAFRPDREATISVRSRALNYGLGCFAGIRGYKSDDGQQVNVFRLDRHVRRLEHSARIIHLRLSGSQSEIAAVIVELIRRNEMRGDVYVRPIVFANSNELSPVLDPDTSETAIFCMPLGRYLSAEPIDVCVSSWWRVRENAIPARAKATGGYLNSAAVRIFTMHTLDDKPAVRAESMNDLIGNLAKGVIRPLIHTRLPLKDARRAHEMIEAREVIGKILLKP